MTVLPNVTAPYINFGGLDKPSLLVFPMVWHHTAYIRLFQAFLSSKNRLSLPICYVKPINPLKITGIISNKRITMDNAVGSYKNVSIFFANWHP